MDSSSRFQNGKMKTDPKVTIIIPNYNGRKFMDQCMDALAAQTYTGFVVLIVDNGSKDGSVEYLRELCGTGEPEPGRPAEPGGPKDLQASREKPRKYPYEIRTILLQENTGFSGAVNVGISAADTEYVVLLNNDTASEPGYLEELVRVLEEDKDRRYFAVSPRMIQMYHPELLDDAGDGYCLLGWAFQRGVGQPVTTPKFAGPTEVFSACAGAAIYRRDMLEEIRLDRLDKETVPEEQPGPQGEQTGPDSPGGQFYTDLDGKPRAAYPYFDPMHFAYLEDLDVCFRAQVRGGRVLYAPASEVLHVGSGTSGSKYNSFKVKLAARNNVFLNYKNMPLLMLLINLPGILLGVLVKYLFFLKRGFGKDYAAGFREGLKMLPQLRPHKTQFRLSRLPQYIRLEWKMLTDTFSYVQDVLKRKLPGGK